MSRFTFSYFISVLLKGIWTSVNAFSLPSLISVCTVLTSKMS